MMIVVDAASGVYQFHTEDNAIFPIETENKTNCNTMYFISREQG